MIAQLVLAYSKPLCRESTSGHGDSAWRNCTVQIGGLAIAGEKSFQEHFRPAFQTYLTEVYNASLGLEFQAVALDFDQNFEFVSQKGVDFIFTNPAAYTCLAVEFELRTVASLVNFRKGHALGKFAGVMFSHANSSFNTLEDIRRARVEAVSISGLGAMQLQQAELLSKGLDIMTDVKRLTFAYNQGKIVEDVESGYADVGFVRTDMIERKVAENQTSWKNFKVLGEMKDDEFPFQRSTNFTPEWPIAALNHVPEEVKTLVGRSLMELDKDSSDPFFAEPALKGQFARWVPPMNYFRLLEMLANIGYLDTAQRKCLRSADVYEAVHCPKGFVKQSREKAFCQSDCKENYTCLCEPCARLRDPELVLQAELQNTSWPGIVDTLKVQNATTVAESCQRMSSCAKLSIGQRFQWSLLDQIGYATRMSINAPPITSVRIKFTADGPWAEMVEENITHSGLETQRWFHDVVAEGEGTHVIEVEVNGQQAAMSPVVIAFSKPPEKIIACQPGHQQNDDGICHPCEPGSVSRGGLAKCRPCEPGTMQPSRGQSTCDDCPAGTAQAKPASLHCDQCPPGQSSRGKSHRDHCSQCEPGQEAPESSSERCNVCARGFYSQAEGAKTCSKCPGGQTTRDVGATSSEQCICGSGTYLVTPNYNVPVDRLLRANASGQPHCISCPAGLDCPGGNDAPLQQPGYWASAGDIESHYSVTHCRNKLECPGGPIGGCASGRQGRACNSCQNWFRKDGGNGTCSPCQGSNVLPMVILLVLVVLASCALYAMATKMDICRQNLEQMTVLITAGQLIMVFQMLSAIRHMKINWVDPARQFIHLFSVFSLDLDILNLSCVISKDSPIFSFIVQLLAYPIFMMTLLLTWLVVSRSRLIDLDALFNVNGLVLLTLYMTLTLVALLPFQCIGNPNNTSTMLTEPGLVCWGSGEHAIMAAAGTLGILLYPVSILTICIRATIMYPSYIRSGHGLSMVGRYRFLFNRFRPDCYSYGVIYLARNTMLTLIPVLFVGSPAFQLVSLSCVLLGGMLLQIRFWPWRTESANISDMILAPTVVLFLVSAAPLIEMEADRHSQESLLSWMICAAMAFMIFVFLVVASRSLYRRLLLKQAYTAFICHHKSAAGSLARFTKTMISKHSPDKVFLDSDQLHDLDTLFETVRSQTKHLVLLLTPQVMTRVWCVGEMATAFCNGIPIVPVSCDGCMPPDALKMEGIINSWSDEEKQLLLGYGISMDLVKQASNHVRQLQLLNFSTLASQQEYETQVLELLVHCNAKRFPFMEKAEATQKAEVLILGQTNESEQLSACLVLQTMMQQALQAETLVVRTVEEMRHYVSTAASLVIVLGQGLFQNPEFAVMLLEALADGVDNSHFEMQATAGRLVGKSWVNSSRSYSMVHKISSISSSQRSMFRAPTTGTAAGTMAGLKVILVNADPGFEFPGAEFYKKLQRDGLGDLSQDDLCRLCKIYQRVLRRIALPFTCHGSEGLIKQQVGAMCERIQAQDRSVDAVTPSLQQDVHDDFDRDGDSDPELTPWDSEPGTEENV